MERYHLDAVVRALHRQADLLDDAYRDDRLRVSERTMCGMERDLLRASAKELTERCDELTTTTE